jgi:hypothetical protein
MTTEIAVLNRLGIALATDSAVTISSGDASKVFNSADKLFELTCDFPVAVMINGNMDCVGIPWEVIIKDFREEHGNTSHNTIEQWAADLLQFAQHQVSVSAESDVEFLDRLVAQESLYVKRRVLRKAWPVAPKGSNPLDLIIEMSQDRVKELLDIGVSDAHKAMNIDHLMAQYCEIVNPMIRKAFEPLSMSREVMDIFLRQVILAAVTMSRSDGITGLIVAGYGHESRFPSVSSFEVGGLAFGILQCSAIEQRAVVSSDKRGHVVAFAQNDVIERLLGGSDPKFIDKMGDVITGMFEKFGDAIYQVGAKRRHTKADKSKKRAILADMTKNAKDEYQRAAYEMQDNFRIEFEQMIAMMPKIELIEFAEALVNITAIERKATSDLGTVGGPVDVAFVSKHEGFVWTKRKYYFPAALNPRYFWRKFRLNKMEN